MHKPAKSSGFRRYSLRTLLLIVAVVGVAFALARIALSPTPRSIMQAARVGVANFGGDERPSALLTLGTETQLSPRAIDAIATFNEERPVRGVIFKHRAIGPEDVRLLKKLHNLEIINVRDAMAVSPDLLTGLSSQRELKKVTMYDSDLTGLSFPEELPLRVLCLDDSIVSSAELSSVATYSQLTHFSACGTSLTEPIGFLGHLTELRHVSLVGTNVTNVELLQLCDLPNMKWIDVEENATTRAILLDQGQNKLQLHKRNWRPIKSDF